MCLALLTFQHRRAITLLYWFIYFANGNWQSTWMFLHSGCDSAFANQKRKWKHFECFSIVSVMYEALERWKRALDRKLFFKFIIDLSLAHLLVYQFPLVNVKAVCVFVLFYVLRLD